jgi:hypothetical protein
MISDAEIVALYSTWNTDELIRLRTSFARIVSDRRSSPETKEFYTGRIAMIDAILNERDDTIIGG